MRNIVTIAFTLLLTANIAAQKQDMKIKSDAWTADINFGATKLSERNPTYTNLQDNVNVGFDVGITKTFSNNIYLSSGVTFSFLKDAPWGFWENPLNYFSVNADLGYKFDLDGKLTEPYLAIGGSYISAPNTIANSSSTFSLNFTGGFIFWLRNSNYGLVIQNTFKNVNDENMVPHNRFTVGVRYRL
jgi:hypothetical protein